MKLEVGMYVRYKNGIGKINDYINNNYTQKFTYINNCGCAEFLEENQVIKASYNIIDLIEVGDYVNGFKVIGFWNDDGDYYLGIVVPGDDWADILPLSKLTIYSIVTKEQFESMSYKIGD
jgi:hypothetical protein